MKFSEYKTQCDGFADDRTRRWAYLVAKLQGEIGEVRDVYGKNLGGTYDGDRPRYLYRMLSELGDVWWYVAVMAKHHVILAPFEKQPALMWDVGSLTHEMFRAAAALSPVVLHETDSLHVSTVARCAYSLGLMEPEWSSSDVWELNIQKLEGRRQRNTLKGDGDER